MNTELKIMSFNIRTLHGDDGTVNCWDNRKNRAVRVIDAFAPDVVGLQEAYEAQTDYLLKHSRLPYRSIGTSRLGDTSDEYVNILYRTDKFDAVQAGQFWLSETPDVPGSRSSLDSDYPRICTWVRLQAKDGSADIYYFNIHFALKEAAQVQAAKLMLERVGQIAGSTGLPVFIGGDFNSTEQGEAYLLLQGSDFTDTWTQSGQDLAGTCTFGNYTGDTDGPHIDWIFQRGAGPVKSIVINRWNEDGLYPSDHYPVELTVEIPGR
ncbi:endonuclease/exonuclease/phosphatase family protein [Paenibacillus physcomitrellae]|uniref:Endonuclease n=2 Tax=Paenibacillus physcomitrellae TaxID=1619311 RepID=A0ABQ1GLK4_9BACL|nr:endonuclease/exonuclease/phosphatase family protein [Paenibacillus physcomitrellae]GGA46241.1 endonuclease [Paenibacillus physcomitrellae]